jgi:hypothetical protein
MIVDPLEPATGPTTAHSAKGLSTGADILLKRLYVYRRPGQ